MRAISHAWTIDTLFGARLQWRCVPRAANPSYEQIWRSIPAAQPGPQLSVRPRPDLGASGRRVGIRPGCPVPAAVRRSRMDDVVNRMARELSDAIAAAVAEDPRIEACR